MWKGLAVLVFSRHYLGFVRKTHYSDKCQGHRERLGGLYIDSENGSYLGTCVWHSLRDLLFAGLGCRHLFVFCTYGSFSVLLGLCVYLCIWALSHEHGVPIHWTRAIIFLIRNKGYYWETRYCNWYHIY